MDFFSKNKYLFWAVIILILLNIILITTFWFHKPYMDFYPPLLPPHNFKPGMMRPDDINPENFIIHELKCNDEQRKQLGILMKEHFKNIREKMDEIDSLRKILLSETFSNNPDTVKISIIADKIGALHSFIEKKNNEHFINMKYLCTQDQVEKLKELMMELISFKHRFSFDNEHNQENWHPEPMNPESQH